MQVLNYCIAICSNRLVYQLEQVQIIIAMLVAYIYAIHISQIQGPFYAPAYMASTDVTSSVLLVASGIGITPFFSVMATKMAEEQSFEDDKKVYAALFKELLDDSRGASGSTIKTMLHSSDWRKAEEEVKPLKVIWSIRDVTELMFYLDYVHQLIKYQTLMDRRAITVDVYLTGLGDAKDPAFMVCQTLFLLSLASESSQYLQIYFGRPDFDAILTNISPDQVFYCGGSVLKQTLSDLCIAKKIRFHPEDFDSGAKIMNSAVNLVDSFTRKVYAFCSSFYVAYIRPKPAEPVQERRMQRRPSVCEIEEARQNYLSAGSPPV
jgi:hypothetical protein